MSDKRTDPATIYRVVTIGNQTWMAENLKATKDINGNAVNCYANTDETNGGVSDFVEKYGCLYVWEELATLNEKTNEENTNRICPSGWRLPKQSEFQNLLTNIGTATDSSRIRDSSWLDGSDSSGFGALPAGGRDDSGYFRNFGSGAYFWSATPIDSDNAYYLDVYSDSAVVFHCYVSIAFSVRCLKDSN